MCGIGGVLKFGKEPIREDVLAALLVGNESRGNDASGIALSQADGTVQVCKLPLSAWKFVQDKTYKKFIADYLQPTTFGAIVHTRLATKGSPAKNENNHPMFKGRVALVHNGIIRNDDTMFNSKKWERSCETDSDILRAYLDEYGITPEAAKQMGYLSGSATGAAFDPRSPKHLFLFRSGNPVVLASTRDHFLFASEKTTLFKALRPHVQRFNMWFHVERPDAAFGPMADNTAWIINDKGLQSHHEFKVNVGTYTEPNRQTYERHSERRERFCGTSGSCNTRTDWRDRNILRGTIKETEETKANEKGTETSASITSGEQGTALVKHGPNKNVERINFTPTTNPTKDDAFCPNCKKAWIIPKGSDPKTFRCSDSDGKINNGCGTSLVSTEVFYELEEVRSKAN